MSIIPYLINFSISSLIWGLMLTAIVSGIVLMMACGLRKNHSFSTSSILVAAITSIVVLVEASLMFASIKAYHSLEDYTSGISDISAIVAELGIDATSDSNISEITGSLKSFQAENIGILRDHIKSYAWKRGIWMAVFFIAGWSVAIASMKREDRNPARRRLNSVAKRTSGNSGYGRRRISRR